MAMETWVELSQEGGSPTGNQLAQALAARVGADVPVLVGWLQGVEALATYAEAAQQPEESALEEERHSVQAALRALHPLLEARLQQRVSQGDQEVREGRCLRCRQGMESPGSRQRSWRSTGGPVHFNRRSHWCQAWGQGRAVAQEQVGLPPGAYTAGGEDLSAMMATPGPYEMVVDLVGKMLGRALSSTGIQGLTERRGKAVSAQQDAEAAQLNPSEPNGLPREVERPVETVVTVPSVASLELDGVLVMSREGRTAGAGAGRGGKGRTYHGVGREVKHAVLYEGAPALYGPTSLQAREWAEAQCERIEQGHALRVIEELRELRAKGGKAGEGMERLITSGTNNLDRMDSPRYRAQGLRVGSGAVESPNDHVTGARLTWAGRRWAEQGAAAMARLRTDLFNGIWETRTRQLLKVA